MTEHRADPPPQIPAAADPPRRAAGLRARITAIRPAGRRASLAAGLVTLALLGALWGLDALGTRAWIRENALDAILAHVPRPPAPPLTVVDIDSAALAGHGPWPWSRLQMARLVGAVAEAGPRALAFDILLAGPDRLSPSAALRRIGIEAARPDLIALAASLPDGDAALAAAIAGLPVVLGAVLEPGPTPDFEALTPVLVDTPEVLRQVLPDLWRAPGGAGPPPLLRAAADGLGLLALEPDRDGIVRRVPLVALAADAMLPGLAADAVRAHEGAGVIILAADGLAAIGPHSVPLDPDGRLRIRASTPRDWTARTVSAGDVLAGRVPAERLAGRLVILGSSAVEVGALRRTAGDAAAPSLQIQADAAATLLSDDAFSRPRWLGAVELAGALGLGLLGLAAVQALRPLAGLAVGLGLIAGWAAAALALLVSRHLLVDAAGPALVGGGVLAVALAAGFIETEWRERRLRRRFEQHLAPEVVARIAANPQMLKLRGERRVITALFTDVEGFTSMTERCAPEALVAVLDRYFDAVSEVIVEHGGMADKIVGDAICAFFNMPLDLPDHAGRALDCALALRRETERLRAAPDFAALGFGPTRIGLESGPVIVGDVGGRRKLDYTAHGMAVSMAARLEAANKGLGTSICIGPGAAALLPEGTVRSMGRIAVRGRSAPVEVFTPGGDPPPAGAS